MTAPNAGNFYTGGTTNADKQAAIQAASTQAFSNFERTSQYMYNDAVIVHGPRDMTAVQQAIAPIVWVIRATSTTTAAACCFACCACIAVGGCCSI